jgi:hypothetical protein
MEIRDAVEADAEQLANLTDAPTDVMRNLVHDRTVRVAVDSRVEGFVSYDADGSTVHVTQLEGPPDLCEQLLEEPRRFAERESMSVELLVPESESDTREAVERADFVERGAGPQFGGVSTTRYRWEPPATQH